MRKALRTSCAGVLVDDGVNGAGKERPVRVFGQFVGDDALLTGAGQGCNEAAIAGAHIVDADHIAVGLQALAEEFPGCAGALSGPGPVGLHDKRLNG